MQIEDDEILQGFIEESLEHLADIENDLLAIEEAGENIDEDLVNKVFRAAHSIKGGAGFMGLTTIQELSHAAENILGMIRSKKLIPNPEIINVLLLAADQLQSMIEDVHGSNDVDISANLEPLNAIAEGNYANQPAAAARPAKPAPAPAPKQPEIQAPVKPQETEILITEPESIALPEEQADSAYDEDDQGMDNDSDYADTTDTRLSQPTSSMSSAMSANDVSKMAQSKGETSIRVHVSLLDSLMTLAGELVLSRNQLLQTIASEDYRNAETVGQRIDLITSELQEAIMLTRMQPIGNVFNKFPRVVRDLSKKLKKTIDLTIVGKDVELDKTIIEAINDPLTHLVRNSVDHGIEMPAERKRLGKTEVGLVILKAYHEAGQVVIEISDDGKGLDGDALAASAVNKGLHHPRTGPGDV